MRTFDRPSAKILWDIYEVEKVDFLFLIQLLRVFNLSMEDDGDTILELLGKHASFWGTQFDKKDDPCLWLVDSEGFKRLQTYAEDKEELLREFYHDYVGNYFEKWYEQPEPTEERTNA